ncbi:MAG: hypothetical protein K0S47_4338 [Herbinix sp.]|jgi:hypothetical protein|nr:hypothetical protein [Herbinix sp.]
MRDYYVLDAARSVSEYVFIDQGLEQFLRACELSEFQFIDSSVTQIEVSKEGGRIFQDFMNYENVPLISDRMKDFFDEQKIDYIFNKKILLTRSSVGIEEVYWLALPQRIHCLNIENSSIDEFLNYADEIIINDDQIGRFKIFKLAGVTNQEIIITDDFAEKLKEQNFEGVHIYPLNT